VSADAEKVLVWNSISWELIESAMRPVGRTGEFEPGEEDAAAAVGRISSMAAAATTVAAAQRFKRLLASGEQRNGGMWRVRADENGSDGNKPTRITKMRFLDGDRSLVSLEQCPDMKALQSLRIWQLEEESGIMASAERGLDQDAVHSLCTQQKGLSIYTCSNGELSAWTCHDKAYGDRFGNMARLWRVECEELDGDFVDVTVSSTMGWVMVPISHGKLLILDEHGNKLRTVVRDDTVFTSACMGGRECLLVGTSKGTILWFNVPSLDVWRRMPYDLALRDSVDAARAASAVALQAWSESSPDSGINGVRVTALSGNGGLCMRYTADQTIAVVDLETGNVCNASFGHLKDVTSLCSAIRFCLFAKSGLAESERHIHADLSFSSTDLLIACVVRSVHSTRPGNVCLYTGSLDETVGIWELDGTKVECSHQRFLDIPSNIHPSLTYRRGLMIAPGNSQGRGNLLLGGDKPTGSAADVNGNAGLADDKRIGTNNALLTQKGTGTQADKVGVYTTPSEI
jgi:WD40 repeat protein